MMICLPPQGTPPHTYTAADMAHNTQHTASTAATPRICLVDSVHERDRSLLNSVPNPLFGTSTPPLRDPVGTESTCVDTH